MNVCLAELMNIWLTIKDSVGLNVLAFSAQNLQYL